MATIEKRGKRYRITSSSGYGMDGKQIRPRMTWRPEPGMTEKQIQKKLERIAVEFDGAVKSGKYVDAKKIRLADFCREFLKLTKPKLAPTTWRSYQRTIELRIIPALGHIKLVDLRPIHIQKFIDQLEEPGMMLDKNAHCKGHSATTGEALSPSTVMRIYAVLRSVLSRAVKLGMMGSNPADGKKLDLPHVEIPEIQFLDETAAANVFSALKAEPLKYQVIIHLALCLGCRRGELVALHWYDVDLKNRKVAVKHSAYKLPGEEEKLKDPKTKSSIRLLTIPEYCCSLLKRYHAEQAAERIKLGTLWHDEHFVFTRWDGEPMNPDTVSQWFSRFLKRHNLPHIKLHALRHSSATLALQNGASIKAVAAHLGHSQLSTTGRYIHALESADEALANGFDTMYDEIEVHKKSGQT